MSKHLVVESDSWNAIKWVNMLNSAPWRLRKWILQVKAYKKKLVGWEVNHIYREGNQEVDLLAKEGINRAEDLLGRCEIN